MQEDALECKLSNFVAKVQTLQVELTSK